MAKKKCMEKSCGYVFDNGDECPRCGSTNWEYV